MVVYMYSLLCLFMSQYSDNVDFMSTDEAYMGQGGNPKLGLPKLEARAPCLPLELPLRSALHFGDDLPNQSVDWY